MQRGTSADILQTLAKLPDAASMIPKIRDLIHVAEEIHQRKFDGDTLKDICDFVAGTNLQANFQWATFYRFLTEQLPDVIRGIQLGWDREPLVIGRGAFNYAFPEPKGFHGFPSSRLTARSKIVVDTGVNTAFAMVLGLDGLGILPKPSNLWDLVPFSFALNWVTGVGANIRRAEYGLFLLAFPTYGVHTLTIEAALSEQDLTTLDVVEDPTIPFRLRWYNRSVSVYLPLPGDTPYGFGLPTGSPSITLIASLLYSLLIA
jgi:hypothetical protein